MNCTIAAGLMAHSTLRIQTQGYGAGIFTILGPTRLMYLARWTKKLFYTQIQTVKIGHLKADLDIPVPVRSVIPAHQITKTPVQGTIATRVAAPILSTAGVAIPMMAASPERVAIVPSAITAKGVPCREE